MLLFASSRPFADDELAAIDAFVSSGKVIKIKQGQWPDSGRLDETYRYGQEWDEHTETPCSLESSEDLVDLFARNEQEIDFGWSGLGLSAEEYDE